MDLQRWRLLPCIRDSLLAERSSCSIHDHIIVRVILETGDDIDMTVDIVPSSRTDDDSHLPRCVSLQCYLALKESDSVDARKIPVPDDVSCG